MKSRMHIKMEGLHAMDCIMLRESHQPQHADHLEITESLIRTNSTSRTYWIGNNGKSFIHNPCPVTREYFLDPREDPQDIIIFVT